MESIKNIEQQLTQEKTILANNCQEISNTILNKKDNFFTEKAGLLALHLQKLTPKIIPDGRTTPIGSKVGEGIIDLVSNIQNQLSHIDTGTTQIVWSIVLAQCFAVFIGAQNIQKLKNFVGQIKLG